MIEDKLNARERLRLECLAQAVAFSAMMPTKSAGQVVADAARFESYVSGNTPVSGVSARSN